MSVFDGWGWGWCRLCSFMQLLDEDSKLKAHGHAGRASGGTRCDTPARDPDPTPEHPDNPIMLGRYLALNDINHNTLPAPIDGGDRWRTDLKKRQPVTPAPRERH